MTDLEDLYVESSLHLPAMAVVTLHDYEFAWVDNARLDPGKSLIVETKSRSETQIIFDGEIVEVESAIDADTPRLIIRAFDRLHRLTHGRHVRTFLNVTDGDIFAKVAQEVGLTPKAGPTTLVHTYAIQANETNLAFLQRRAAALGYCLYVKGKELHCNELKPQGSPLTLTWGEELQEFRSRLSVMGQVKKVTARSWDPKAKREVIGEAEASTAKPKVGHAKNGGATLQAGFHLEANTLVADRPLRIQKQAELLAKSVLEQSASSFIEAEGCVAGDPLLTAGKTVKIQNVGERFSGEYLVTSATHLYNAVEGYLTRFTVSGLNPATLLSLLAPPRAEPLNTLVIGIVTDNQDPDNLGRVKVKFPWLDSEHASNWARVVAVGAGTTRGIQFLPEVNDEVLVGFEQGDIEHPYVLGGLWNGKDAPPEASGAVKGGQVEQRIIRSRTGHSIILNDSAQGGVTIKDKNGNSFELNVGQDTLTITTKGDMKLKTQANLNLEAGGSMKLKATGNISVEGMGVKVDGGAATVDVKGSVINLN